MKRFHLLGIFLIAATLLGGLFFYGDRFTHDDPEEMGFYSIENGVIHYWGSPVSGADARSFKILDAAYAKDNHQVYYFGEPMSKIVDAKSFKPLNAWYAKDKNYYYVYGDFLKEIDTATFKIINGPFAEDKNGQYYVGSKVENADFHFLEKLSFILDHEYLSQFKVGGDLPWDGSSQTQQYWRDNHQVYYESESAMNGHDLSIIKDADLETIKMLNRYYAVDKDHLYTYGSKEINNLSFDYMTIEPLQYGSGYLRDKDKVFGFTREGIMEIEGADAQTFQYFDNTPYAKDKNQIYLISKPFLAVDYETFHTAEYNLKGTMITILGKDKNGYYMEAQEVECPSDEFLFSWDEI
ncbi:DKNYY domain-containing protein [Ignatzschineria rhizosphaerae]|uniref:DKNYY domain-containing protein n=1 Tax=Ignatzschineria rhizosphaerae TaxID=2923279 RepID=A0ABY3X2T3_9GAMM|nr:DKNYY domain-containing protein [Ignatzschineria rhizosphaerae]UNM96575.1 DKNYY domain-containing protein [Ignatzschineria rhizosphaerae]